MTGDWRGPQNEELCDFFLLTKGYSADLIRKKETSGVNGTSGRHAKCIERFGEMTLGKETAWKT